MNNKVSIRRFAAMTLIAFTMAVINGCNDEEGTPENTTTTQIGSEGGALKASDGTVSISIPSGAMSEGTQVSIQATEATAPKGVGKVYTLLPEGTQFAKPVALSFHYSEEDIKNIPLSRMAIAYKKEDGSWQIMPTVKVDETTKTITTETNHFSQWSIIDGLPAIAGFSPVSADDDVNTTITISGQNFSSTPSENVVTLNDVVLTVAAVIGNQLVVTLPAGATSGKIKVAVNGYTVLSADEFTIVNTTPSITSFSPTTAVEGMTTTVAITGTRFSTNVSENIVSVNGVPATVVSATATQLMVILPGTITTGPIKVVVKGKTTQSATNFIVTSSSPAITSFEPTSMVQGIVTTVSITGTNFSPTPSANLVSINGMVATVVSATTTQLVVIIPGNASSGLLTIVVNGKTGQSDTSFTVVPGTPAITSFSPTSMQEGTPTNVTINGSYFSTIVSDNVVTLNGVPLTVAVVTTAGSASTMTVLVPANATTGTFKVTVNGVSATAASNFTVISTVPQISGFAPASGEKGIDTTITINGSNFSSVPSENHVTINGVPATVLACTTTTLSVIIPGTATSGHIQIAVDDKFVLSAGTFTFN